MKAFASLFSPAARTLSRESRVILAVLIVLRIWACGVCPTAFLTLKTYAAQIDGGLLTKPRRDA